uniref:E-selectin n=1 Tax=Oryzias latipes TaxID=8090 RepID=A0A3B3HKR0_ORYLA
MNIQLLVLMGALLLVGRNPMTRGGVQAWTYAYSKGSNLQWHEARQWCQKHFVDMVSIKNKEEAEYLDSFLPRNPTYYWIGVQKVAAKWTWVDTSKPVPVEAQRWASEEPDSLAGQDCVELYIKRAKDSARWNNEKCSKLKEAVCYTASCTQESCSAHGECEEAVGNFTCKCHSGFLGLHCKEAVACKALTEPRQGSHHCVHPNGPNRFNSSCRFHCELGFRLVGVSQLACQGDGQWNHPVPQCEAEHCPALNQTGFWGGSLNCSHPISTFSYNSTCEFFCDDGYELAGQNQIRCDHTGQWTPGTPACSVKKCSAAVAPSGGNMVCVDPVEPFSFGSQCDFTCQEGHYLLGNSTISCLASGDWSHPAPSCAAVQCKNLSAPLHGFIHCWDPVGEHSYGSECSVQCEDGFELVGTNLTKCSARGDWSHGLPVCQAKLCQTVTSPSHGFLSCNHPNGPFSFGSTCSITCDEGFRINGTSKVECFSSAMWSADIPTCTALTCPPLSFVSHGSTLCSDPYGRSSFGSRCTTACGDGFLLNGTANTECTSAGTWSFDVPFCSVKRCSVLKSPAHGSLNCSEPHGKFSFGSRCRMSCDEGFFLNGTADFECSSQATWSTEPAECLAKTCPPVSSPAHGSLVCSDPHGQFSFGSRCASTCEDGFVLNGTEETNCTSSGMWSQDIPRCFVQRCPPLSSLSHGSLACSGPHGEFSFASRCTFTCGRGYLLTGAETTECTSAGTWSKDMPLCRVQQCPRLVKAPQHGRMNCSLLDPPFSYGSRCDYDCNEGFRMLKGAATVTCEHSGRWSQDVPTCHPVQCGNIHRMSSRMSMNCSHPLANFSFGSECIFTCADGFSLNGSTALFCSSSGFWSHRIPTCTVKKCSAAVAPSGGNMVCVDPVEPFSFGSQCDFTCQEGHYLLGNSTISCLASGDWSNPAPSCAAVQCKNLSAPLHGFIHCWDPLGEHSYGSECSVQCEDGFELVGTNLTKCSARGDWSHGLPVCQAKLCQTVTSPSHGFLSCNHPNGPFSFGSTCSITCDEGFRINGTSKVECFSSAMWSTDIPTCTAVQCGNIHRMSSRMSMNCSHPLANFSFGSECIFTCADGFSLNGSTALFCSSSGFWSHQIPTCTGSSLGLMILQYAAYGAACAALALILFGLTDLIIRHLKKGGSAVKADDLWADTVNPTFEL